MNILLNIGFSQEDLSKIVNFLIEIIEFHTENLSFALKLCYFSPIYIKF